MGIIMNITLPETVTTYIEEQVAQGDYPSASAYLIHLVQEDRKRKADERLEELLLEGIHSGPDIEVTPSFREQFMADALERHQRAEKG